MAGGRERPGPKPRAGVTAGKRIEIRLSAVELERWQAAANGETLTLSDFVRAAVEQAILSRRA